jgi:hypothetical protein
MCILGKVSMIIVASLLFVFQVGYIVNVFLTIKYKLEMMDNLEKLLIETYSITQILSIFIIFDVLIILFLLTYILFIK